MSTNDPDTVMLTKTERASPLDPINVYAVISLVAALLGLFPVAIVFGILAFTRPAGRGIAVAGLVLGVLELAALLVVLFGMASAFTDDTDSDTGQTVASSVFEPFIPTAESASSTTSETSTPSQTTPSPTAEASPLPTSGPVLNESCSEGQASVIATDANTGQNIVCTFLGAGGGYKWVQTAEVSPGTHERGDSCDPATDRVGRTAAGTALICVSEVNGGSGGSWEPGP
ncbi:DUF4190 domain-containing protein [Williamsia herbipolensis]|uniref:DUF4190 domain-containing protein n=1 Tax=Williamsia herbipolensis TaxID=1603258 RepID=A0AAU4JZ97_9NOCA|nr:DUF4190 domain-containing protein [Williamsia herbipolensis]